MKQFHPDNRNGLLPSEKTAGCDVSSVNEGEYFFRKGIVVTPHKNSLFYKSEIHKKRDGMKKIV